MSSSFKYQKYALSAKNLAHDTGCNDSVKAGHELTAGVAKLCVEQPLEHVEEVDCNSMESIEKFLKKHHFKIIDHLNEKKHDSVSCDMLYVNNFCGLRAIVVLDKIGDCSVRRTTHGGSLFGHHIHSSRRLHVSVREMSEKIKCKDIAYVCADGICLFTESSEGKDSVLELHKIEEGHRICEDELSYARYKKMYMPIVKYSDLYKDPHHVNEVIIEKSQKILEARHTDICETLHEICRALECAHEEAVKLKKAYLENSALLDSHYESLLQSYKEKSCDKVGTRGNMCFTANKLLKCLDSVGDYDDHLENLHNFTENMSSNINSCNLCVSECKSYMHKQGLN